VLISHGGRFFLSVLVGAIGYVVLLHISYGLLQNCYIPPSWWYGLLHSRFVASFSWFVLVNFLGAVSAAVPVALCVAFFAKSNKLALALLVGFPSALFVIGDGIVAYGFPAYAAAWAIEVLHFLSIGLAVLLEVAFFLSRPLTSVGRDHDE
jgi:hypothetical protein